jgi:hypothetical protein
MMARVGRLSGALLAESEGHFWLVGDLKEPCDFAAAGFEPPGEIDAKARPFVRLCPTRQVTLASPWLRVSLEGEALAHLLSQRLVIERNGSVSDRLWRLIIHESGGAPEIDARWLVETPRHVWQIVRDNVLRCS